jgi:addiction module HigA family antidote
MRKLKPVTPGELLLEEFLMPMGVSQYRLAKEIGVPAQRIGDIVAGKRAITADTADTDLRLCRFRAEMGTSLTVLTRQMEVMA